MSRNLSKRKLESVVRIRVVQIIQRGSYQMGEALQRLREKYFTGKKVRN